MSANEIKGPSETCDTGAALSGSRLWERLRCPSTKCHSPQLSPPLLTTAETQHSWDSGFQCRAVDSDGARFYLYLSPGRGGAISFHPHTRLLLKKTSGLWAVEFPYRCNVFIKTKNKNKKQMWVQAEVQRGDFHVLRLLLLSGRCISAPILAEVSAVSRWPVRAGRVSLKKNRIRRKQINTLRLCGS